MCCETFLHIRRFSLFEGNSSIRIIISHPLLFLYPVRTFISFSPDLPRFPCPFYLFVLLQNSLNSNVTLLVSPLHLLVANLQDPERWWRPCWYTVDSRFTNAYWNSTTPVFLSAASGSLTTVLWLRSCSLPSLLTC